MTFLPSLIAMSKIHPEQRVTRGALRAERSTTLIARRAVGGRRVSERASDRASDRAERIVGRCLLAIGDVHLGTRPSGVPPAIGEELAGGLESLTPAAALRSAVDLAIREGVDALLFAGDVVESANARFEALPALEAAVRRLAEAGIPVVGVAGNHDVEALPRLADLVEGFELIGRGGHWQAHLLSVDGAPTAEIVGWSFPEQRVTTSPIRSLLDAPLPRAAPGVPRIGLLHGDMGASGGPYAPFSRQELEDSGLDAWLLGHIHRPSLAAGAVPRGYLGSLVGLDPSETGPHGPWMIHLSDTGEILPEQLPTAPLRWEQIDVEVVEDQAPEDVEDLLFAEAERTARQLLAEGSRHAVLGLRLQLVGRVKDCEAIRAQIARQAWRDVLRSVGQTQVFIDKVTDRLEVAADLRELAKGQDPPGLLARKLLILEEGGPQCRELLDRSRAALEELARDPRWLPLDEMRDAADPLSDRALTDYLHQAGMQTLQKLLAQRPAAHASDPEPS